MEYKSATLAIIKKHIGPFVYRVKILTYKEGPRTERVNPVSAKHD